MVNLFDHYINQHFVHAKGERGVRNLKQLIEVLGYKGDYMRGGLLEEFFADNPGAIHAVLDFVAEYVERNSDWEECLRERIEHSKEEDY